jgi:hypothetical protein
VSTWTRRSASYYVAAATAIEAEGGAWYTKGDAPAPTPEAQHREAGRIGRRIRRQFGAMAAETKVIFTKALDTLRSQPRARAARGFRRVRRQAQRRARAPADPDEPAPACGGLLLHSATPVEAVVA